MSPLAAFRLVFAGEVKRLLRDRRALLFAVVLPMVAYPLLFLFTGQLDTLTEERMARRELRLALDLRALSPPLAESVRAVLGEPELALELTDVEAGGVPDREGLLGILGTGPDGAHLLVVATHAEGERPALHLVLDGADDDTEEAESRVRRTLRNFLARERDRRLLFSAGEDPGAPARVEVVDVARPEDTAGQGLGALFPLLAALILISGGSFAALDSFAGEREAGTLETLLVQPVPAVAVAWGKFAMVLAIGSLAMVGNGVSLFGCLVGGLGSLPTLPPDADWGAAGGRLALSLLLFLPCAAFIVGLLCLLAARARSFRQGQLVTMPLSLVLLVLTAPATQPTIELGPLLALVPVTGPAIAMRDALSGVFQPLPQLLAFGSSLLWAGLALSRLTDTLDAERLLANEETAAEAAARRVQATTAIRWGITAVLVLYVVGGRLQAWDLVLGTTLTLWGLALGMAVLAGRGTARRAGEPLARTLGLGAPQPLHLLGALLLAPALARTMEILLEQLQRLLPLPSSMTESTQLLEGLADLSPRGLFLLLALSPGICEELLFRGALLSGMRRDLPPVRVVLWQALLFGAAHASVYRFLPTAVIGAVLAALTLRTRTLWPAMVLHVGYNGILVLGSQPEFEALQRPGLAWLALPGLALLLVRRR